MAKYDLNITAKEMITVEADSEKEAAELAFSRVFDHGMDHFASASYEVVYIDGKDPE